MARRDPPWQARQRPEATATKARHSAARARAIRATLDGWGCRQRPRRRRDRRRLDHIEPVEPGVPARFEFPRRERTRPVPQAQPEPYIESMVPGWIHLGRLAVYA